MRWIRVLFVVPGLLTACAVSQTQVNLIPEWVRNHSLQDGFVVVSASSEIFGVEKARENAYSKALALLGMQKAGAVVEVQGSVKNRKSVVSSGIDESVREVSHVEVKSNIKTSKVNVKAEIRDVWVDAYSRKVWLLVEEL